MSGVFGGNNFEILIQRLKENGITYPQVKIDTVIQKISGDDFKDSELIGLFSDAVRIEGKPLHIIKFSTNSLHEDIAPYIIQALMARSIKGSPSFTTRDLTREIFEDIWDSFDTKYQTSLCGKVATILKMAKNNQLTTYLKKDRETWSIKVSDHWKSRKKFAKNCQNLIDNLSQKTLFDYGVKKA
ncbi:MAG: hypothetical protein HXS47_07020 [Theionarchaea archaeon]|nr:hypothetical protein [Theionarchaea archaeon]